MDLETLKIDLKGLKEGANHLVFDLDDTYFKAIDAPEVSQGRVHVSLDIVRTENDFFTLDFHEAGMVLVPCDICLELMEQPIETTQRLEVRLGTENSEEDDLVTVAEDEGILDVAWYLYEF
uniref:YceD family protein n=1 Tax=Prevotella histicola TaxID=470565 RepID=UPI00242B4F9A